MNARNLSCVAWDGGANNGVLKLLDQRLLPEKELWLECRTVDDVVLAIRNMTIRGAPAIGIAAAYGMVLAMRKSPLDAADRLAATRPTAVNLFWALDLCRALLRSGATSGEEMLALARSIHEADAEGNRRMGEIGAAHIKDGMSVLTHCNAGALATGGYGTALAPIYTAHEQGRLVQVFVDETRPRLQGARLTAWELSKVGVPYTLICDNMAASLMAKGKIHLCITGADRIAANGDAANKIGTYSVAVAAAHHQIPFHIAAPCSTFDLATVDGSGIAIEERIGTEVSQWGDGSICPTGARIYNPAFDVTPAALIRSIFTEQGEIYPVRRDTVTRVVGKSRS